MTNHLATYLREKRLEQNVSLGQLARRLGYCNVAKGANRILGFEQTGEAKPKDLPVLIADALCVSEEVVLEILWQDYRDLQQWLDEPVPMQLVVRLMAAVYCEESLPAGITANVAEEIASKIARERQRQVCLVVSRRLSVWFDEQGNVVARTEAQSDLPNNPFMQVVARKFLLDGGTPPSPVGEGGLQK